MDQLLETREEIINIIKKYENIIVFILKFITGLVIYVGINNIGFALEIFHVITKFPFNFAYIVFMGLLFALLPLNVNYALIIINITLQFSQRLEVALIIFLVLLAIFLFYAHFGKKESAFIIAIVLGFYFNMVYAIPIFAGLYFGLTSIIPIVIGVFIWSYSTIPLSLMSTNEVQGFDLDVAADTVLNLYSSVGYESLNGQQWLLTSLLFTLVLISVYIVSKMSINYAKEIAVLVGVVINIFGFVIFSIFTNLNINIFATILFSIVSGILILAIKFFDIVLDYSRAENVEFEDENNYYYVKVIPKIKVKKQIKSR